jgi:hypothetical protein
MACATIQSWAGRTLYFPSATAPSSPLRTPSRNSGSNLAMRSSVSCMIAPCIAVNRSKICRSSHHLCGDEAEEIRPFHSVAHFMVQELSNRDSARSIDLSFQAHFQASKIPPSITKRHRVQIALETRRPCIPVAILLQLRIVNPQRAVLVSEVLEEKFADVMMISRNVFRHS